VFGFGWVLFVVVYTYVWCMMNYVDYDYIVDVWEGIGNVYLSKMGIFNFLFLLVGRGVLRFWEG